MGFLTRCKCPFLFDFLLHFHNMHFSFFLQTFLILFEKQQLLHRADYEPMLSPIQQKQEKEMTMQ